MTEETENKMKSRKFLVWIVWLIIAIAIIVLEVVQAFVTNEMSTDLIEKVLGWFFAISAIYLGVNFGQKVGLSFADAMKQTDSPAEDETTEEIK